MNLNLILKNSFILLLAGTFTTACANNNQKKESLNQDSAQEISQSDSLMSKYYALKDALVETDYESTKQTAETFLKDEKLKQKEYSTLVAPLKAIAAANDVTEQREHFKVLSNELYKLAQDQELSESPIYRQFCPMAFGGEGGYWLSNQEKIMNPYFGDKMLHCGMVKEEL